MEPLQVVCISDGRPGHEKQSRAVIAAMGELTALSTTMLTLRHTEGFRRFLQGARSLFASAEQISRLPDSVDMVIGTGSSTHLPMIGLKMRTQARLVTCMAPDAWLRPLFDLCLIPRHDRPASRRKYFSTFGPPCLAPDEQRQDPFRGLILVGGVDEKSHNWNTHYFISQVKELIAKDDLSWTVASSRRTPPETVDQLHLLEKNDQKIKFYSADETPSGWIEKAYATHGRVWVTADSVSMVYEAMTAGCRVGILPVQWKQADNKFQFGIDELKHHGMIGDFEQWANGVELPIAQKPLNEAERCAKEILRRWWPDRLR